MSWVAVGMGVGGAVLGGMGSERKRQQTEAFNKGQAEVTRYSPWTGLHGNVTQNNNDWFSGALQGGLSGAMQGQAMGKAAAPQTPSTAPGASVAGSASTPGLPSSDDWYNTMTAKAGQPASSDQWASMMRRPGPYG